MGSLTHIVQTPLPRVFLIIPALLDEGGDNCTVVTEVCLAVLDLSKQPVHPHILVAVDVVHSCFKPKNS